jgi:hypothetical protein
VNDPAPARRPGEFDGLTVVLPRERADEEIELLRELRG